MTIEETNSSPLPQLQPRQLKLLRPKGSTDELNPKINSKAKHLLPEKMNWLDRLLQESGNSEDGNFYSCYFKDVDTAAGKTYYSTIEIESSTSDTQKNIGIEILIFFKEFEFNSPGERFYFKVPVSERNNFGNLITYTYDSTDVTYYSFTNLGFFGQIKNKRTIPYKFTFEPEEFGLFYSDFHKKLTMSK
jgi:hypothetical protein